MPRKRHTAEQIIRKLREAEVEQEKGLSVGAICKKLEVPADRIVDGVDQLDFLLGKPANLNMPQIHELIADPRELHSIASTSRRAGCSRWSSSESSSSRRRWPRSRRLL